LPAQVGARAEQLQQPGQLRTLNDYTLAIRKEGQFTAHEVIEVDVLPMAAA